MTYGLVCLGKLDYRTKGYHKSPLLAISRSFVNKRQCPQTAYGRSSVKQRIEVKQKRVNSHHA